MRIPKKSIFSYPMLILILFIGVYIRVYDIDKVGIYDWDSAYYGNTAKVPILTAKWLINNSDKTSNIEDLKDHLLKRGCNSHIIKPGHLLLITASYLVFGIKDYAVLMVSVLCGIGVILLTFIIGKKMFGKTAGYLAAAIISVSGQQVIYSRTGFPQMDTTLIFCLAFLSFWVFISNQDRRKFFFIAAIISGLTLLFHQSVYLVIIPLLIAVIMNAMNKNDNSLIKSIKDCFYFCAIMFAILLSTQLLIMIINSINPSGGEDFLIRNMERYQAGLFERWSFTVEKLIFYPIMFWRLEGPIITILIPVSILFVFAKAYRTRSMNYILVVLLTIIPITFWILNYTTLKGIQVVMPFLALCAGVFITEISGIISNYFKKKKIKTIIPIALSLIILLFGYHRVLPYVKWKSNYKPVSEQLISYMKTHDGIFNISQNTLRPILSFYIGNEVDRLPADLKERIFFENVNIKTDYRVIDWRQFIPNVSDKSYLLNISKEYIPIIELDYRKEA